VKNGRYCYRYRYSYEGRKRASLVSYSMVLVAQLDQIRHRRKHIGSILPSGRRHQGRPLRSPLHVAGNRYIGDGIGISVCHAERTGPPASRRAERHRPRSAPSFENARDCMSRETVGQPIGRRRQARLDRARQARLRPLSPCYTRPNSRMYALDRRPTSARTLREAMPHGQSAWPACRGLSARRPASGRRRPRIARKRTVPAP
jgi:hypothetical protein